LRSKLRRVAESGRQWETVGDIGSLLLGVFRASKHEQETLGAIGSSRKSSQYTTCILRVYYVYTPCTTNLMISLSMVVPIESECSPWSSTMKVFSGDIVGPESSMPG
jgi:hypothetical protein